MTNDRLSELLKAMRQVPLGRTRTELLELAINETDVLGEAAMGYRLRMDLIHSAVFHGLGERAISAFAWCLKYSDENPGKVNLHDCLWKYKWILGVLPRLPQISKAKLLEMVDDMGRRVDAAGYSQRPVYHSRWKLYFEMGDFDAAATEMEKWRRSRIDSLKDCPACELDSEVDFQCRIHQDEKSLELAQPILAGRLRCSSVPHATLGIVVRPLIRLRRFDEANKYSVRGYRMTSQNEVYLHEIAEHLLMATRANQRVRAMRMFTRHASWSLVTGMASRRYYFDSVAAAFLEKLGTGKLVRSTSDDEQEPVVPKKSRAAPQIRLPVDHPLYQENDTCDALEAARWYRSEADELASQFDRRNGNEMHAKVILQTRELAGLT